MKYVIIDKHGVREITGREDAAARERKLATKFLVCRTPQEDFLVIGIASGDMVNHADFSEHFIAHYGADAHSFIFLV